MGKVKPTIARGFRREGKSQSQPECPQSWPTVTPLSLHSRLGRPPAPAQSTECSNRLDDIIASHFGLRLRSRANTEVPTVSRSGRAPRSVETAGEYWSAHRHPTSLPPPPPPPPHISGHTQSLDDHHRSQTTTLSSTPQSTRSPLIFCKRFTCTIT